MKTRRFLSLFLLAVLAAGALPPLRARALEPPEIFCKAALLVDAESGASIYSKNEEQELYPASLTKIMTCLLVLEDIERGHLAMDQEIAASDTAFLGLSDDGSTAKIQAGEVLTVEELLYCLMMVSANEASTILAEAVSGSVDAFVDTMNARAEALGCTHTHFVNPHGLHDPRHYSSARDIYLICKEALGHKEFLRLCDTPSVTIPATASTPARTLRSTNYLINGWTTRGYLNSDAHGIKTGHTSQAGYCLASSAVRGSMSLICVVLGGDRIRLENDEIRTYSFYDTNQLYHWVFDNFAYQTVLRSKDPVQEVPVALSKRESVTVRPSRDVDVLLPSDLAPEDLERQVTLAADPAEAPIAQDDVLGSITLSYGGTVYATVDLLAVSDVEASRIEVFLRDVRLLCGKTWVRAAAAVLAALAVLFLVWKIFFSGRRYRYGRSVNRGANRRRTGYRGRRR